MPDRCLGSSEYGTYKTATARFLSWLSDRTNCLSDRTKNNVSFLSLLLSSLELSDTTVYEREIGTLLGSGVTMANAFSSPLLLILALSDTKANEP